MSLWSCPNCSIISRNHHILNSHTRQSRPSYVQYVQVPVQIYVSVFQQQLCFNCLLYTYICTNKWCKFILKILWHVSVLIHLLQGVHRCVSYILLLTSAPHTPNQELLIQPHLPVFNLNNTVIYCVLSF